MEVIITDLNKKTFQETYENVIKKRNSINVSESQEIEITTNKKIYVIYDDNKIKSCTGCFECWIKIPGKCKIKDNYENLGKIYSKAKKITIISKCCYGSYSPFVKNVLDRSIPYLLPFFKFKNREMHHSTRYKTKFNLNVYFYGENLTEKEKETAEKMVEANVVNLDIKNFNISFFEKSEREN